MLEGGVFLQTMDTWKDFILAEDITAGNAAELYFEEENMDAYCRHLESSDITYVHDLHEHAWGQHVIRFYDPEGHIIEVGEQMRAVVMRFMHSGLSAEQTAQRMDVPEAYIRSLMQE